MEVVGPPHGVRIHPANRIIGDAGPQQLPDLLFHALGPETEDGRLSRALGAVRRQPLLGQAMVAPHEFMSLARWFLLSVVTMPASHCSHCMTHPQVTSGQEM